MTKQNYQPGTFEAVADMQLTGTPTLNTWYHFRDTDWRYVLADVTLKQAGTAIPSAAFELAKDDKYTALEVGKSGKELYCQWRIVNATYAGISTTVSGNNFGSYTENELLDARLKNAEAFELAHGADVLTYDNTGGDLTSDYAQGAIDELDVKLDAINNAASISYDNTDTGYTATDVQDAVDELNDRIWLQTKGAEVDAYSYTGHFGHWGDLKIENPSTTHGNAQYAVVKITISTEYTYLPECYMIFSITGSEVGITNSPKVLSSGTGIAEKSAILLLPFGLYRIFFNTGSTDDYTATIKYKIVDSKISYT